MSENKNQWKVEIARLVEIIAERMYSDPIQAGLRELITNSLDARQGKVMIRMDYKEKRFVYIDDGLGIDPQSFKDVYGKIASGHIRKKQSRGLFGIGRMALIAASEMGRIVSYYNHKKYSWLFDKTGWEGPVEEENREDMEHGILLEFEGLELGDDKTISDWISKTFTLPLEREECEIDYNGYEIYGLIDDKWKKENIIESKYGKIDVYTKPETEGNLFICQKGILVREEPYTGLTAFLDQEFLDIKTDREGFVNNEKYRYFKTITKRNLADLRPLASVEKTEVDFIKRLMREFKKYWVKKTITSEAFKQLEIQFPETGKEIVEQEPKPISEENQQEVPESSIINEPISVPSIPEEPSFETKENDWTKIPTKEELETSIEKTKQAQVCGPEQVDETCNECHECQKLPELPKEETKSKDVVIIKGAKPMDMGEDYPVISFETDPFVLVFNTSHPIFKKMVDEGKLGSHEMAVLFERMFECAYLDQNPSENLEEIKKRWKEVDVKLKELFK